VREPFLVVLKVPVVVSILVNRFAFFVAITKAINISRFLLLPSPSRNLPLAKREMDAQLAWLVDLNSRQQMA